MKQEGMLYFTCSR